MQTIKTAVVVVLLLFVIYGGYVAITDSNTPMSEELEGLVEMGETAPDVSGTGAFQPVQAPTSTPAASEDPFKRFASLPAPSFGGPGTPPPLNTAAPLPEANFPSAPGLAPSNPSPTTPSSTPSVPKIPDIDIPDLELPKDLDVSSARDEASKPGDANKVNAVEASSKSEPGFGLAVPNGKGSDVGLLPKLPGQDSSAAPKLDLPTVHGDAKTLADVTATRPVDVADSPTPSIPTSKPGRSYENAKQLAMDMIQEGQLRKALAALSLFYNAPELTSDQRADLLDMLDALAREVIYSRNHNLDFPYVVAPGDTFEQISRQYDVPGEVIARINGLDPSREPEAGAKLKVVPGPFRAEIDLARDELTLFLGDLYAGRYPVSFGSEPAPKPGIYQVAQKSKNRNYYSSNGAAIEALDPTNPYGGYWIDLGENMCIHGSPRAEGGPTHMGCISLSPLDADDVFGMLGTGSQVTIRR